MQEAWAGLNVLAGDGTPCMRAGWASDKLGGAFDAGAAAPVHVISEHLPLQDLRGLYAAADAFVLPSRRAPWLHPTPASADRPVCGQVCMAIILPQPQRSQI
jgi:hypothetical protein